MRTNAPGPPCAATYSFLTQRTFFMLIVDELEVHRAEAMPRIVLQGTRIRESVCIGHW
jgi:hypothetical protein